MNETLELYFIVEARYVTDCHVVSDIIVACRILLKGREYEFLNRGGDRKIEVLRPRVRLIRTEDKTRGDSHNCCERMSRIELLSHIHYHGERVVRT